MFDEITQFTGDHESQIKQSNGIIEKISQSVDFSDFDHAGIKPFKCIEEQGPTPEDIATQHYDLLHVHR